MQKIPKLAGVNEAAEILGWKKQKIVTYISRGVFPEPIQRLASGPIWTKKTNRRLPRLSLLRVVFFNAKEASYLPDPR